MLFEYYYFLCINYLGFELGLESSLGSGQGEGTPIGLEFRFIMKLTQSQII